AGLTGVAGVAEGLERLPAVLHLHSDLSTGDFSLEQLTAMAEKEGIGALLLTDNYLLRVEYGLPPFRALTRAVRDERSVLDLGIDRYLARVSEANLANPRVLIEEHTSELQSPCNLVCRLLLEKKKYTAKSRYN